MGEQGVDFSDRALGLATDFGAGLAGQFGGVLCAALGVDGETERESIIPLRYRLFGAT